MRPLISTHQVPGQVEVYQRAEPLEVQPLGGGIRTEQQADFPLADLELDVLAAHRCKAALLPYPGPSGAGIDGNRLSRYICHHLLGEPVHRVVVLAENDASAFEPPILDQATPHDFVLGIPLLVGLERRHEALQEPRSSVVSVFDMPSASCFLGLILSSPPPATSSMLCHEPSIFSQ